MNICLTYYSYLTDSIIKSEEVRIIYSYLAIYATYYSVTCERSTHYITPITFK